MNYLAVKQKISSRQRVRKSESLSFKNLDLYYKKPSWIEDKKQKKTRELIDSICKSFKVSYLKNIINKKSIFLFSSILFFILATTIILNRITYFSSQGIILPRIENYSLIDFVIIGNERTSQVAEGPIKMPLVFEAKAYTVKSGDTVQSIAKRFGRSLDSIISINNLNKGLSLSAGRIIKIPNIDGIVYKVKSGDSLSAIANKFKVKIEKLADINDLQHDVLYKNTGLFIPGAQLPKNELNKVSTPSIKLVWPSTIRGLISSRFGFRADPFTGAHSFHAGIDIIMPVGSPVKAVLDGKVVEYAYSPTFGYYMIINHSQAYQSLYGHLSANIAKLGQSVKSGDIIAMSGNTGYSTGPHLHFGLYKNGKPINPIKLFY